MLRKLPLLDVIHILLNRLHDNIQTSEHIIKRTELPEFRISDMLVNTRRFGELRVKKWIDYQTQLNAVRTSSSIIMKSQFPNTPAPVSTQKVAITLCGVGECDETSNRMLLDLAREGYRGKITMILVEGGHRVLHNSAYTHVFLLVGEPNKKLETTADLAALNDDCLLVDGLLKTAGKANDYKNLIGAYLDVHGTHHVKMCVIQDVSKIDCELIYKNATEIAKSIKNDIREKKYHTKVTHSLASVFTSITEAGSPFTQTVAKIKAEFEGHARKDEICEALASDLELAFRKVCAYGNANAILLMLNNRNLLLEFDSTAASKSTGKTGLDWLKTNERLSASELTIIREKLETESPAMKLAKMMYHFK